ncbi:hypothetical protein A5816_002934 [Enterococcus sp. 3G1_DIV0629]|nr:hypothetical protein A5816_002934 [Enterococcus sp. 3G1_DIV0629]
MIKIVDLTFGFKKPIPVSYTHLDVYKRQYHYSETKEK